MEVLKMMWFIHQGTLNGAQAGCCRPTGVRMACYGSDPLGNHPDDKLETTQSLPTIPPDSVEMADVAYSRALASSGREAL